MERQRNETHAGSIGWLAIAGFVAVFDLLSSESLSHAFTRGMQNEYSRPLVLGGMAVTALHLLDVIPHQYDPFYATIDHFRPYDVTDI